MIFHALPRFPWLATVAPAATLHPMQRILIVLTALGLAGCATPPDEHIIPFSQNQTQALFARSRPPQAFGLTVYSTDLGPVFAGANRVHQGQFAQMPFINKADSNALEINLTARGVKEIPALIDTASRENWVSSGTAGLMSVVLLAGPNPYHTEAVHVYDAIGGYAGLQHKIMLDTLHVENVVLHVRAATGPLGAPARWMQDPAPDVVLGVPFLRAFSYVTLDFSDHLATFSATRPFQTPEDTLLARAKLIDIRGVLGVEGSINGEQTTFVIDSGGDFEIAQNEPKGPTIRRAGVGDLMFPPDIQVATAREIGLGEIEYPRIGRQLLSRYRVTFDFRNKWIYFERPGAQPASFPTRTGFQSIK